MGEEVEKYNGMNQRGRQLRLKGCLQGRCLSWAGPSWPGKLWEWRVFQRDSRQGCLGEKLLEQGGQSVPCECSQAPSLALRLLWRSTEPPV